METQHIERFIKSRKVFIKPRPQALAALLIPIILTPAQAAIRHHAYRHPAYRHPVTARSFSAPPDSYLQRPVYSVNDLVQEVRANPQVRQRYAHHFLHISPDQLAHWMQNNLVESWVPTTKTYSVYCVSPSGKYFRVRQKFTKGTKVFALKDGTPLLKWICGNPLFEYEGQKVASNLVTTKTSPTVNELAEAMQENLLPLAMAEQPLIFSGSGPATIVTGPSLQGLGAAAAALPLLGLFSNSGGGGGVPHTPPLPLVGPAVPEPAAPLLLLAGLPALAMIAVRRRELKRR